MESSWVEFVSDCRSRMSALARSCFLRRRYWRQKCRATEEARRELEAERHQFQARCQQLEQQQAVLREQVATLRSQLAEPRPVSLPVGAPPPGQQYGANLIELSVNLGRELGIRPAQRALRIFLRG